MLATLLTLAFLATAILATVVVAASLAKGLAAATSLRQQLALVGGMRTVTVRHQRVVRRAVPITARTPRRPRRLAPVLPARVPQRVAA